MITELYSENQFEIWAFQSSKNGATYCGDDYYIAHTEEYLLCVLADGLGSGEFAYESSHAVIEEIIANQNKDVEALMDLGNGVLTNKRGAAVSVIKIYFDTKEFVYSSVGNIRFFLYNPKKEKLVYPLPVTGFLSGRAQKYRTQRFKYEPGASFILHSDGVQLQGAKALLKSRSPLEQKTREIIEGIKVQVDDSTFIIGSLLS
ncbi:PP2C family serine/threonine-protein phosphatase [Bacillus cihuensis]|uniref:PP2C family serine/threonine-protein phosphatase n=1 Tax=Bacillus cihuensis TaxID=1208599 RepID=UPI0004051A7B|nr:PP2C family serine/threonine-protein phosphatase [Bacillus cihuensis]